jgi:sugar-specific transcriptional regulator TrmB
MAKEQYAELLEKYRKETQEFAKETAKYVANRVPGLTAAVSTLKVPDVSRIAINAYQDIINELHECIAYHQVLLRTQELANMTMAEQKARKDGTFLPIHMLSIC